MLTKKNKIAILVVMFAALTVFSAAIFLEEKWEHNSYFYELTHPRLPDYALEIIFSKPKYALGEEIFFGVLNKTDRTLRIENECPEEPLDVYRLKEGAWQRVKSPAAVQCKSGKDVILRPYELKGASYLPWQGAIFSEAGRYKIELRAEGYGNRFEKEFEITKPAP